MREYLANAFVFGLSVAILWHFSLVATRGQFTVGEPRPVVLALEIVLIAGLTVFSIVNMIRITRRL